MPEYNPGQEAVAQTASPNIQTVQARSDPNGSVSRLLGALGTAGTQDTLARFSASQERQKLEDQTMKLEGYTQQFMQDHGGGAVSQAQVKERFPETVPVIAARIAESVGRKQGASDFAKIIEQVNGDDSLRLDTAARNAFITKARKEQFSAIASGNEFFAAGVAGAMDQAVQQQELKWQGQTAQYHEQAQRDALSAEVVAAFNGADPKAALDSIDSRWGRSSSLNNIERNKIVVNSAIDLAFVNDDPAVFGMVPSRFLNVDSKAALEKARVQLIDRRVTGYKNAEYLRDVRRKEDERNTKLEIIDMVVSGRKVDPAAYRESPEAFEFAMKMREAPRLDESFSVGNAQVIKDLIHTDSTSGRGETLQSYTDKIVSNPNMNPKEKQALLAELPKVLEGAQMMSLPAVRQPLNDILAPALAALDASPMTSTNQMRTGINVRSQIVRGYDNDIRRLFEAEREQTGSYPKGHRQIELVDIAVERAGKQLVQLTRLISEAKAAPVASPTPAAAPAPVAPPSARGASPIQAAIAAELAKRR